MDYNFNGKAALVTGAASGIGLATARGFAREGAGVILADINVEAGEAAAAAIVAEGGTAAFVACDVSDEAQVEAAVGAAVERYGRLDCAFNNAGIEQGGVPITDQERESWDRYLAINLTGCHAVHEARGAADEQAGERRDRERILDPRRRRRPRHARLRRHQGGRRQHHPQRRPGADRQRDPGSTRPAPPPSTRR